MEPFSDANTTKLIIAPFDMHEACLTINPQETLRYGFESSAESYFNIHYHNENDEAFYPVPDHLSASKTASFSPDVEAYYCLMWTNPTNEGLELSLSYTK